MTTEQKQILSKVPRVTLIFWIIKILATTLGETGGDAFTMSFLGETTGDAHPYGYLIGTAVFAAFFFAAVAVQIRVKKFHPMIYWVAIIASTTVGTTLADYVTRSLGIGYSGGSLILLALLLASLFVWYRTLGSVSVESVREPKAEMFYWMTIMFSQTLGTALGDWTADDVGLNLGYSGAAIVFGAMLVLIAAAYFWTKISRTALFLVCVHHHKTPWRCGRRFSGQANRKRRIGIESLHCHCGLSRSNCCIDFGFQTKTRRTNTLEMRSFLRSTVCCLSET